MNNQATLYNTNEFKHDMEHLIAPTRMEHYEKLPDANEYKEYDCEYEDAEYPE